ncbi:MAG: D-glucuronyl C5-epimerase family protein [Candidatus ainarchaeum sp.]|nr:D-glucuronyl C5-epimerase family protein [Candidatus ainarchaeum sp.]
MTFVILRFRINRWIKRYPVYFNNKSIKDRRLYYIESEKLFLDNLIIDSNGVAINNYCNIGLKYNPAYVAWFGLQNLNKYVLKNDKKYLDVADKQIIWLIKNIKIENDSAKIYYDFNWKLGSENINKPWISGLAQGILISFFLRYYLIKNDEKYKELAIKLGRIMFLDIKKGGLSRKYNNFCFIEEYPTKNPSIILDGYLFSVLAIYDLYSITREKKYLNLFKKYVNSFIKNRTIFIYKEKWTYHGLGAARILNSRMYNDLIIVQLKSLLYLSKNKTLQPILKKLEDKLNLFDLFDLEFNSQKLELSALKA